MVLKVEPTARQLSLNLKQILDNPWDTVKNHYPVGKIVEGNVIRLAKFGAFVELEEGIDAVAAPIFDHLGIVVASVSIGGPSERCRPKQAELIGAVTQAGQQVSQALRYVGWH